MQEGDTPLCEMEEQYGTEWRSDKVLKTSTGKSQTLKQQWCERIPIYNYIIHRIEDCQDTEEEAVAKVQQVFDENCNKRQNPNLSQIAKTLRTMLDQEGAMSRYGKKRRSN